MSETSASRDRLADLVMRRVKRSGSTTSGLSSVNADDAELRQAIKEQLNHKQRVSTVVSQMSSRSGGGGGVMTPAGNMSHQHHHHQGGASPAFPPPPPRSNASTPVSHSNMFGRPKSEVKFKEVTEKLKTLQSPPRLKVAATPLIPIRGDKNDLEDDLWAIMAKQKDAELIEIRAKAKAVHTAKLQQQKAILDEQCAIRRNRKQVERSAHLAERSVIDDQKLNWDQERRDVSEQLKTVAVRIREDREQQVHEQEQRKVAKEEERKEIDRLILERMQSELVAEKERELALKARAVVHREGLIAANEVQKKIQNTRKAEEEAMEKVYAEQFKASVEKTEKERTKALQDLRNRMKGKEAMALKLQATMDQKAADDEARADKVTEARYQQKIAREQAEIEKKKEGMNVILEFRAKQLEIKQQRKEEEKRALAQEKLDAEQEVRESIAVLKARREAQKVKVAKCKDLIVGQIKDNQEFHPVRMSEEERNLNKGILHRAKTESPQNYRSV